ncbi:MAG: GNAT family N-acetyltransferase [Litoreibacter sp.]|nr:GNAT family N-acetyltransferase [Litoreibacter sp.]MCY4334670.1 GNAT family N-acetyltransferase [Litoreibacter sp.]
MRETTEADLDALMTLYPLAFPDEELRPLVKELLDEKEGVFSFAVFDGAQLIGHALYSLGAVGGKAGAALLGPLAVAPSHQRQGVGRGLQLYAHNALSGVGVRQVFLLGDPKYYSRIGFAQESLVTTPCPIPDDWAAAWQSQTLGAAARFGAGALTLPLPWMNPVYWSG